MAIALREEHLTGGRSMANTLLMPKATAVWLVDNTALSFEQIAEFCSMHVLEIKAIADGDSAQGIKGLDPINAGQLTRDELAKGQADPNHKLKLAEPKVRVPEYKRKGPRYMPTSKRQERTNAIMWLVKHHPELKNAQIIKLVGTTKSTIEAIRDRSHWNSANLQPLDPVTLGICTQIALDMEVEKAQKGIARPTPSPDDEQLLPVSETQDAPDLYGQEPAKPREDLDADAVFSRFSSLNRNNDDDDDM